MHERRRVAAQGRERARALRLPPRREERRRRQRRTLAQRSLRRRPASPLDACIPRRRHREAQPAHAILSQPGQLWPGPPSSARAEGGGGDSRVSAHVRGRRDAAGCRGEGVIQHGLVVRRQLLARCRQPNHRLGPASDLLNHPTGSGGGRTRALRVPEPGVDRCGGPAQVGHQDEGRAAERRCLELRVGVAQQGKVGIEEEEPAHLAVEQCEQGHQRRCLEGEEPWRVAAGKGGGDKTRSLDAPLASACQSHSMLMAALV
mmetsp:Transcript_47000/g.151201  ORF Transcript_47000/g.151201 Transcript_47000/m.151201 type:complete len:260 (+) Transcript_47000:1394-2173(+)